MANNKNFVVKNGLEVGGEVRIGTQATATTDAVRADRLVNTSGIATGGGNLTADRTISVPGTDLAMGGSANTRTITSSTGDDVSVPVVTTSNAGFMSTDDKTKLDGIAAGAQVNVATNLGSSGTGGTRTITSSTGTDTSITYTAADLDAVPTTRSIIAGNGLTGGGNLTADRTITLGEPETVTTTSTNTVSGSGHSHALTLPASATRGEISTANITNTTSSTLGFISGRRMNDALTNYGDPFDTAGTYNSLQAGSVQNSLTPGSFITGSAFNGSVARTFNVNATSANTANTVVARDGSGNFSANIITGTATQARYADLAERYAADYPVTPGTVVVFGGEQEITQSTQANDHRVAGVVSTDPAHLMNADAGDDQTHPAIALSGRVPVKVTGPVRPGDLMVTSDIPGHAQADNNASAGRIIGKAIGKNQSGQAVIEVLITPM